MQRSPGLRLQFLASLNIVAKPVAGIYIEQGKAGRIHGSAHWPEMTYSLP